MTRYQLKGEHPSKIPAKRPYPADARGLPFLAPDDRTCNSRLARKMGYCSNAAGQGTGHPGVGRCALHGGGSTRHDGADGPRDQMVALGLGAIVHLAETMTQSDEEYLYHVGNAAAVVARASIIQRMNNPASSPKELADLTMALQRLDSLLAKYPQAEDPDAASNTPDGFDEELARLTRIEGEEAVMAGE